MLLLFLEVKDELERLMYDVKRTGNSVRTNLKGMLMCEILIMIKNCHFCIYKNPIYNYFLEYVCQAKLCYKNAFPYAVLLNYWMMFL